MKATEMVKTINVNDLEEGCARVLRYVISRYAKPVEKYVEVGSLNDLKETESSCWQINHNVEYLYSDIPQPGYVPERKLGYEHQYILEKDWIPYTTKEAKIEAIFNACKDVAKKVVLKPNFDGVTSEQERAAVYCTELIKYSNNIRTSTRRSAGNLIVCNDLFMEKLEKETMGFGIPFFNKAVDGSEILMNNCIHIVKTGFKGDKPEAIITFAGAAPTDGGNVLVEDTENLRFAIANRFYNSDKYYIHLTMED